MQTKNRHNHQFILPTAARHCLAPFIALAMAWASLPLFAQEETAADDESTLCVGEPECHCGGLEVIRSEANGVLTVYTTFEGGTHLNAIHPENANWIPCAGMRFFGSTEGGNLQGWLTVTRPPGLFQNNPSGNTIATWRTPASSQRIEFANPVSEAFLHYSATQPVRLDALDANGTVVASVQGLGTGSQFNVWRRLSVSMPKNTIVAVRIFGASVGRTGVDDVGYRRYLPVEVPIDVKPGNDNEIDPVNLKANGSLPLAVFSTPDFDATTLDPVTLQLGDPNLIQIATVVWGNAEDLDGDGLPDVVLHFSASELVDGGALSKDTTELLLTGCTTDGQSIFGKDQVRIVGGGH